MRKSIKGKVLAAGMLLSYLLTSVGCGGTQGLTQQPPMFYDPGSANQYDPNQNPLSNIAKGAVDGVRPKIVIKNTFLRVHKDVGVLIHSLIGEMVSKDPTSPVNFDDLSSFSVSINQAKLALRGDALDNLMKNFVLNYPGAPLKELKHTVLPGGRLNIKGKMKQAGMDVPFEMEGPMHATREGLMELTPEVIKTLGIPAKGLMDFLGLETAKMINLNETRGMKMVGNTILMYPDRMFPPPAMKGKVVRTETDNNGNLFLFFDNGVQMPEPPTPIQPGIFKNYKHIYGGAVKMIGNEVHEDTNIMMVDMDQSNPFDFFLGEYVNHSMAGQVNILSAKGALVNFMPDYLDIPRRLNRKPTFESIEDGVGERWMVNPDSDPAKTKRQNWARQPKPQPIGNNNNNQYPY